jgi:hypothetical protein
MKGKSLERWESRRKGGFARFVLKWGLLGFGSALLLGSIVSVFVSFWLLRRDMAFQVELADILPFVPRLLLIAVGGGALTAVVLWFSMESAYRRAQRRAARA